MRANIFRPFNTCITLLFLTGTVAFAQRDTVEFKPIPNYQDPPDFIQVDKQPSPLKVVQPEYPDSARRGGIEGTVYVKILVQKDGKVRKAVVIKSDAEIFNEAAVKAALQWTFDPAMLHDKPVEVWAALPFRFKLDKTAGAGQ